MRTPLLLLLVFLAPAVFADLYKCTVADNTSYQDKPCLSVQNQSIIVQQPPISRHEPISPSVITDNIQIKRDEQGRIKRSEKAKHDFKVAYPCPATGKQSGSCPGYVIDHIKPLACGGLDHPSNMQWQTVLAGKIKDGWERDNCQRSAKTSTPIVANDRYFPQRQTANKNQIVHTGSRGGRYVVSRNGKKRYLKYR